MTREPDFATKVNEVNGSRKNRFTDLRTITDMSPADAGEVKTIERKRGDGS